MTHAAHRIRWTGLSLSALLLCWHPLVGASAEPLTQPAAIYSCTFTPAGWDAKDWTFVRRRDLKNRDEWLQLPDCIENKDGSADGHTSMVYIKKLQGDLVITATMSFADRLAPCVELASQVADDAHGVKLYDAQVEVVLWNEGINIWSHHTEAGKESWKLRAYGRFPLEKNVKYKLQVTKNGKDLSVSVAGHVFGYVEESLADEVYVGVTACEGVNRFYDFAVSRLGQ